MLGFKHKTDQPSTVDSESQQYGAVFAQSLEPSSGRRLLNFVISPKVIIGIVLIIVVAAVGYAAWLPHRSFTVGTHSFTNQDISNATAARTKAQKAGNASSKEIASASTDAQKDVVLLAALETEADKKHIPYSTVVIDTFLRQVYQQYGGRSGYMSYMQTAYGWNQDDVYRHRTIEYLENKMQQSLISTRKYSMTFVRWDNIRLYNPNTSDYNKVYAAKMAMLKNDYLPLYRAHASEEELTAKAQVSDAVDRDTQTRIFQETKGVPIFFSEQTFGIGHSTDTIQEYPEGLKTASVYASLKKVGDYTGPVRLNDGTLSIVRLEASTGGPYASWDDLRIQYQQRSHVSFGPSVAGKTVGVLGTVFKHFGSVFRPVPVYAAGDCLTTHAIHYQIRYIDQNTGGSISGGSGSVSGNADRSTTNCNKSDYVNHGFNVTGSGTTFNAAKSWSISGSSLQVDVDCNGNSWSGLNNSSPAGVVHPSISGYTYQSTNMPSGENNPFPFHSGINATGSFDTVSYYTKNVTPPSGNISCTSNTSNITISFNWANAPSGIAVTRNDGATIAQSASTSSGTVNHDGGTVSQGTSYTYTLKAGSTTVDTVSGCKLQPPAGTNSVNCSVSGTTASISFSWTGVNSTSQANLRPDSSTAAPIASGAAGQASGSSSASQSGLAPGSTHTYYLTGNGTILAQGSCTVPSTVCNDCSCSGTCCTTCTCTNTCPPPPSSGTGSLSCGTATSSSLTMNYSYSGTAGGVYVYWGAAPDVYTHVGTVDYGAPNNSATSFTVTGLSPGQAYNFAMQDSSTGSIISGPMQCSTSNPQPFTTGGTADPGLDSTENPTSVTPTGTPTSSTGSPSGLKCTIVVTKAAGGTPSASDPVLDTYGEVSCTVGSQITGPKTSISIAVAPGDAICATLHVTPATGILGPSNSISSSSGEYVQSPPTCRTITQLPIFKVFNSSISSGGDYSAVSAGCNTTGTLAGWFDNTNAANSEGTSAQLATYALAQIIGVGSNHTSSSRSPTGLSFANTVGTAPATSGSPLLGGLLGGTHCITAQAKSPGGASEQGISPANANITFMTNPSSVPAYTYTGQLTITNSPGKKVDKPRAIFVNGDVYISEDIQYDTSFAWTTSTVPSFMVVATGNIFIAPGVTHLDGTYEAGGTINTCGTSSFTSVAAGSLYSLCKNQLTVVGSFVAKKINFLRTYGSLHNEGSGSCSNSPGTSSVGTTITVTAGTCAAEVFEFSPEHYLEQPAALPGGAGATQYDAVTSLPPVL